MNESIKSVKCSVCTPYEPKDKNEAISLVICRHGNMTTARIARNDDEMRTITIRSRPTDITVAVGDEAAVADAVVVIAMRIVDPKKHTIGITYQTELTIGFLDQIVPQAFYAALQQAIKMPIEDLTTKRRPS